MTDYRIVKNEGQVPGLTDEYILQLYDKKFEAYLYGKVTPNTAKYLPMPEKETT